MREIAFRASTLKQRSLLTRRPSDGKVVASVDARMCARGKSSEREDAMSLSG
ncbi:hypothetical protein EXIGLDRAFT_725515 [Exidia glandulosa HHB12029]|uniref:Uncharacterized protein n=1 Tax=Exidia glandulosa HHB12029 TaxID=1314781 RepID=A0A165ZUU5_EXIGL|nr:hypothetical protein EXIGLDRAFT_725515 [Exidia glandulosa HHB12029]